MSDGVKLAAKLRQIAPRRKEGQAPPIGAFNMDGLCLWELNELINQAADMLDTRKSDDGWRTMESAPKDGSEVLGYIDEAYAVVKFGCGRWTLTESGAYAEDDEWWPTYWRPLPSPPKEGKF